MRRKLMFLVIIAATLVVVSCRQHAGNSSATTLSPGFTSTTLAVGRFLESDVVVQGSKLQDNNRTDRFSVVKTQGSSDLYVQSNVWQPGGSTGWHTHPGHSLIIVTAGTVTEYDGNDPDCKPHPYSQGMGFVDPGHGHVHIIRNEGSVVATSIAVQLVPFDPSKSSRRIDVPAPASCRNIM